MHRKLSCHLSLLLFGSLLLLSACSPREQLFEQRILQFGTIIDITIIHHDVDKVEQAFVDIETQLEGFRHHWHAWEDSDLYRFNRSLIQAEFTPVAESLRELISLSQYYYETSQKLFNPALGKLIDAFGFHGTKKANHPLINRIQENLPTMPDLVVKNNIAHSTNANLQLDFGGIAKGYAIARLALMLKKAGFKHFLINAGGDVHISGQRFDKPWTIAIQNPFATGAIASIQLSGNYHLFTSGNYQRFYKNKDKIVHHIIDPRSGQPSTRISSATVLTTDAVLADVATTTLMIDGWKNHSSLADSLGITDYLIVNQDMDIIVSRSLSGKIKFLIDVESIAIH